MVESPVSDGDFAYITMLLNIMSECAALCCDAQGICCGCFTLSCTPGSDGISDVLDLTQDAWQPIVEVWQPMFEVWHALYMPHECCVTLYDTMHRSVRHRLLAPLLYYAAVLCCCTMLLEGWDAVLLHV